MAQCWQGMADMLVTTLVKSNKYMVVEREKLVKAYGWAEIKCYWAVTSQRR